jgi:hypothetical protein
MTIIKSFQKDQAEEMFKAGMMNAEEKKFYDLWKAVKDGEFKNEIHLEKLEQYINVPRSADSSFIADSIKDGSGTIDGFIGGLFGNAKLKDALSKAPLIYGAVVQANSWLFEPGQDVFSVGAVFVFALDAEHIYNIEWLTETAAKISEIKRGGIIADDMKDLLVSLKDDLSHFCLKIGSSVAGDADAWCTVFTFKDTKVLPRTFLPANRIVPFFLKETPQNNSFKEAALAPVSGRYYE